MKGLLKNSKVAEGVFVMENDLIMKEIMLRVPYIGNFSATISKANVDYKTRTKSKAKKYIWLAPTMAIVACSIASVCVLTFYHPNTNSITTNINSEDKTNINSWDTTYLPVEDNTYYILPWDQRSEIDKYPEFTYDGRIYDVWSTTKSLPVSSEYIEENISNVSLTGYDIYEDKNYVTTGNIYKINGIYVEYAVALQFDDSDSYYAYINPYFEFFTLGDLKEKSGLKEETASFGHSFYSYVDEEGANHLIRFDDDDDSLVWDSFFSNTILKNDYLDSYKIMNSYYFSIRVNIPRLGIVDSSACFLSFDNDGNMAYNAQFVNTNRCVFNVGKEIVEKFIEEIKKNVRGCEVIYIPAQQYNGESNQESKEENFLKK